MSQAKKRKNDERMPLALDLLRWLGRTIQTVLMGMSRGTLALYPIAKWSIKGTWRFLRSGVRTIWMGFTWPVRMVWRGIRYLFLGYVPDHFESPEQEAAFWRVKRYFRRRRFFYTHFGLYLMAMVGIWGSTIGSSINGYYIDFAPLFAVTGIWSMMIFFHFLRIRMADAEDRAISEILEGGYQQSQQREAIEKRKRQRLDSVLRDLSDDDLIALRHRLSEDDLDDSALYQRLVGDDGDLLWEEHTQYPY